MLENARTDWLGSKPVFYNEKTKKISYLISDVIDYNDLHFHPEGLRNYLKFGYSVMGQTPFENIKFLRYSSSIGYDANGELQISNDEDPAKERILKSSSVEDALETVKNSIHKWEKDTPGTIVLPLSGGYDSKLLLACIEDKQKIKAFSYGYSRRQSDSFEVVRAGKVAEAYGIDWKHIPLGGFLKKIPEWYDLFGASVHAHGMYQLEFYDSISRFADPGHSTVLSGIIGDAWAGNTRYEEINGPEELYKLSYSHGMEIDDSVCLLDDNKDLSNAFWNEHKEELKDENWRIVFSMRMKIMLLRYLLEVPNSRGFDAWSPFLDFDVAMSMLTLPWEEKNNRKWQKNYFESEHIEYGWLKKECDYNMVINETGLRQVKLQPLNSLLLGKIVDRKYVDYINDVLSHRPIESFAAKPQTIPNVLNKAIKKMNDPKVKALYEYEILYPLQRVMEKSY